MTSGPRRSVRSSRVLRPRASRATSVTRTTLRVAGTRIANAPGSSGAMPPGPREPAGADAARRAAEGGDGERAVAAERLLREESRPRLRRRAAEPDEVGAALTARRITLRHAREREHARDARPDRVGVASEGQPRAVEATVGLPRGDVPASRVVGAQVDSLERDHRCARTPGEQAGLRARDSHAECEHGVTDADIATFTGCEQRRVRGAAAGLDRSKRGRPPRARGVGGLAAADRHRARRRAGPRTR